MDMDTDWLVLSVVLNELGLGSQSSNLLKKGESYDKYGNECKDSRN